MKHILKTNIAYLFTLILVLFPGVIFAQNKFALSVGQMNFDYAEYDNDSAKTFLDGEDGNLRGFGLEFTRHTKTDLLTRFAFEYYAGTVAYDGHLQSITDQNIDMFPFQTDTDETVTAFHFGLSKPLHARKDNILLFYGSFSYKKWERDIQGRYVSENGNQGTPINLDVPDLFETYTWYQFAFGLDYHGQVTKSSYMELHAGLLQTLDPEMEIGPYKLKLKEKSGYEGGISWLFKIAPNRRVGISGKINYWEFGRSNPVPISMTEYILEPDSESKMITFKIIYEQDLLKP